MEQKVMSINDIRGRKSEPTQAEPKERRILRAGIYARYSTIGNSPYSSEEQIQRIRFRLARGEITSRPHPDSKIMIDEAWVVKDDAVSGRVTREGYELIVQAAILGKQVDVMLFDDLSRLSRDLGDTLSLFDAFVFSRVEGISVSDGISTYDDNARDLFTFKGYSNEQQARQLSKHTIRGLEVRVLNGFSTGHSPYGYETKPTRTALIKGVEKPSHFEIIVKPDEAEIIVRIWSLFANGHGQNAIATLLNQDNVKPPARNKACKKWTSKTIWNFLTNEKYCGRWVYRTTKSVRNPTTKRMSQAPRPEHEWIVQQRDDLRIVSPELEMQVAARRDAIRKSREAAQNREGKIFSNLGGNPKHLLIGTMTCGECGGNFMLVSGKKGGYVGCYNAYRQSNATCRNKQTVQMAWVEESLFEQMRLHLEKPATYEYLAKRFNELMALRQGGSPSKLAALDSELASLEKKIANYQWFIGEGHWSQSIAGDLVVSEQRAKSIRAELDHLKRLADGKVFITPMAIKQKVTRLDELLGTKVVEANRILRRIFPEKIVLYPQRVGKKKAYRAKAAMNLYGLLKFDSVVNGVPYVLNVEPAGPGPKVAWNRLEFKAIFHRLGTRDGSGFLVSGSLLRHREA